MTESRRSFSLLTIFLIALLAGIIAIIAFRLTYALQILSFESDSNVPTIESGEIVVASNLQKPEKFNFVLFRNRSQAGSPVWCLRICGTEGDSVEIRDGNLYINNKPADSGLSLSHSYIVLSRDTARLDLKKYNNIVAVSTDTVLVVYPDHLMKESGIQHQRYSLPPEIADAGVQEKFGEPWNIDNLGPVAVPKNYYFLLGDNRAAAVDSRYFGFISRDDCLATVIMH